MLLLPLFALSAGAQVDIEAPEPYAEVTDKDGEMTELSAGGEFSGGAPVVLKLYANAEEVDGYSLVCSWEFFKEGETERNVLSEFNSNNTQLLTVEQTKEKIASLAYIQERLAEGK